MDLIFVNLGIEIEHLGRYINIFGIRIAYYGLIVSAGILLGIFFAAHVAELEKENPEDYYNFACWAVIFSLIGARIYYVAFTWNRYKDNWKRILDIQSEGFAIYGGIIAAVLTLIVYAKVQRKNFFQMADVSVCGLTLGQVIGRWGDFFNCEAFGGFTNNIFAMRIRRTKVAYRLITEEINRAMEKNYPSIVGKYIQVHPTFLYESMWNLGLLTILLAYREHRKFKGEMFAIYLFGYGTGRAWIEGLRTDQLKIGSTDIAVSQLLSCILAVGALAVIITGHVIVNRRTIVEKRKHEADHEGNTHSAGGH